MRQRAYGDKVDAGFRDRPDCIHPDAAACFRQGSTPGKSDGFSKILERHVIEQHDVSAGFDGLSDLGERVGFNLDLEPREPSARSSDSSVDGIGFFISQGHEMVVLDENLVVEPHSMIGRASASRGVFFEQTPSGSGFAGVEKSGFQSFDRTAEFGGLGGDAREVLREVERGAFSGEEGPGGSVNCHEDASGGNPLAILGDLSHSEVGAGSEERGSGDIESASHERLACDHVSCGKN